MKPTIYFHTGIQKTGSTSIQQTMFNNREALLAHGINYLPIDANHGGFLISLLSSSPHTERRNIARFVDTPEKAASYNIENQRQLQEVLSCNQSPKVLISAEGLSTIPEESAQRLRAMFDPYAAAYRVIIYVRDPYDFANSATLQKLKSGATLENVGAPPLANFRWKIEKFINVFGRENVDIRVFGPSRFAGGDLISDFVLALGESPALADKLDIRRVNLAMSHEAATILSEANGLIPSRIDAVANRARALSFHVYISKIKGERFSVDPGAYQNRQSKIIADLDWLQDIVGEQIFGRPSPRPASQTRWSDETVQSIKDVVSEMAAAIEELRMARPASTWRTIFDKPVRADWRYGERRDFSQAFDPDLKKISLPAELEWLAEAVGQAVNPRSTPPRFDQAGIRALACFLHRMVLTIERLKAGQAAPSGGLLRRLVMPHRLARSTPSN